MPMIELLNVDCLAHMKTMDANSVDAIVTDPPYGLSFMGKDWDHGVPGVHFWEAALRVAKPGAYLLAFGGTRTFHRLAVAIEDAGWEMRDTLMWVYGSGFPKSHNVAIGIDKANGAPPRGKALVVAGRGEREDLQGSDANPRPQELEAYAPATEAAKQWQGWGTALKPAWEPIIMARKPLEGTVAQNVLKHGTGAINVDGCRVDLTGAQFEPGYMGNPTKVRDGGTFSLPPKSLSMYKANGRWPANVIHDGSDEVVKHFPQSDSTPWPDRNSSGWKQTSEVVNGGGVKDTGSAARFFYVAKSSKQDRNEGLDRHEIVTIFGTWEQEDQVARLLVDTDPSHPKVIVESTVANRDGSAWSTLLFGSEFMDQFQQECRSTTSTATSSTTGSRTLKALRRCIISGSIPGVSFAPTDGGSLVENVANQTTLILTTSERTESAIGVENVTLPTQLRISAGEGRNVHSTVKPTDLMRYLCRLVTPPGGTVFDPFMGSGSTGKAAVLEGFSFIGCDLQAEYVAIAQARCAWAEEEHFREHAQQSLFPVESPRLFAPEPVAPARQTSIEDAH